MSFANTLPESVAEVETASEQDVDLGKGVLVHRVDDTDAVYIPCRSVAPSYVAGTTDEHRDYDAVDYRWRGADRYGTKSSVDERARQFPPDHTTAHLLLALHPFSPRAPFAVVTQLLGLPPRQPNSCAWRPTLASGILAQR